MTGREKRRRRDSAPRYDGTGEERREETLRLVMTGLEKGEERRLYWPRYDGTGEEKRRRLYWPRYDGTEEKRLVHLPWYMPPPVLLPCTCLLPYSSRTTGITRPLEPPEAHGLSSSPSSPP